MKNLIPLSETVHADKSRQHDANINNSITSIQEGQQALVESQVTEQINARKGASSFQHSRSQQGARSIVERHEAKAAATLQSLYETVGRMTHKACWIDSEVKDANFDSIMESSKTLLEGMITKGLVTIESFKTSASPAVRDIFNECVSLGERISAGEIITETDLFGESFPVSESEGTVATKVRGKVKKMIGDEKEIAQANKDELEDLQEGRRLTAPRSAKTLWRSLIEFNTQHMEVAEGDGNVNDQIMGEAMVQYTFLETLNTMGVLDMNASSVQEMCRNLSYKNATKK